MQNQPTRSLRRWLKLVSRVLLCCVALLFGICFYEVTFIKTALRGDGFCKDHAVCAHHNSTSADESRNPLRYIPAATRAAWLTRDFLVVFGIPSEDIKARRRRRNLQRATCWQYGGVAAKGNNYTGTMVVLYVLARSPQHQYKYSQEMLHEAKQWNDIVALDINEGNKTTERPIGVSGFYGYEAEVTMSRKTFMWFDLALRTFSRARYIAKGDDDTFLRVPQYLADFYALPPHNVYWGYVFFVEGMESGATYLIPFALGRCYTLQRSIVKAVVSYEPLRRLVLSPYNEKLRKRYHAFCAHHEDVMIGRTLNSSGTEVSYVNDPCRFPDLTKRTKAKRFNAQWMAVHHVAEHHYEMLMKWFAGVPVVATNFTKNNYGQFQPLSCKQQITRLFFIQND